MEPVTHAVLNALKRMAVIGLGAALTHEHYSAYYVGGAAVAVAGVSAYSLSKFLRTEASHTRMRILLLTGTLLLIAAFANRPASVPAPGPAPGPASGPASGATPAAPAQRGGAQRGGAQREAAQRGAAPLFPVAAEGLALGAARPSHGATPTPDHGPNDSTPKTKRPPHGLAHAKSPHAKSPQHGPQHGPPSKPGAKLRGNSSTSRTRRRLAPAPPATTE